jgi:acyl CoA:acetate/3-ketoacid CoA transferase
MHWQLQSFAREVFSLHGDRIALYQLGSSIDVYRDIVEAMDRVWIGSLEQ